MTFVLDDTPLDSPFFLLDGGGTLVAPGRDILVEIDAYDITNSVLTTFYYGSRAYNDPSAPNYYAPRLSQPLNFRRDIYSAQTTGGASRVSYGELRLDNNDGGLDFLRDYGLQGQRIRMLIGDVRDQYSTFEGLIVGRIQQVFFNTSDLTFQIRDRLQDLAIEVPVPKYAGDNVLPDGLEGVSTDDIKDKSKPLLFGLALNFAPPCVNTTRLIYQMNDGPVGEVVNVRDGGESLDDEGDYTDQADMEANDPTPGFYRAWLDGGYFRLGAEPASTVTCTATDVTDSAESTAAQVAVRVVTLTPTDGGEGGVDSSDINFDDVEDADEANDSTLGIWFNSGETYAQILDQVLGGSGFWYGFDRLGQFRMRRLDLPTDTEGYAAIFRIASNTNRLALGEFNIINYRFMPNNDPERGMPAWRVTVQYLKNYTVLTGSALLGVVLQVVRNLLGVEFRDEIREDSTVRDAYPLAVEKKVATLFASVNAAGDEAARLLEIYSAPRDFLEVDTVLQSDLIALVDIGDMVTVDIPRFDYDGGKLMRVIGMEYNASAGRLTLSLWG